MTDATRALIREVREARRLTNPDHPEALVTSLLALDECCHHLWPCGCRRLAIATATVLARQASWLSALCEALEEEDRA